MTATRDLPRQPTRFIGREHELADIARLLADPACRLLTLVGPGGIGKTRLALQAAAEQSPHFTHDVHFVPLQSVTSPDLLPSAIASALKITFYGAEEPRLQLIHYLREKHLLLVLDNFEHLLAGVDLLTEILEAAPGVKMLVTSREALNLQEEWLRRVDGLRFPISGVVESVEDYSAIRLFVERARRVRADFSLADEWEEVVRICQLVEGMPLAVELAAAWLKTMNCTLIAAEIQHNLDFLASPLRNVPERHRSMRAVFDYSWKLLTSEEQTVFRTLAVFRGGFDREAAQQVAGVSLPTLTTLVDKSLLQWNAAGRYDLHELLRQYAEGQLEASGESASALAAHSAYYMNFLARRDEDIKGRRQQAALNEIKADFENIRAGWRWAVEHQRHDLIQRSVLNCLVNFGEMSNLLVDIQTMLKQTATAFAPTPGVPPHPIWEQMMVRSEWINFRLMSSIDHVMLETILGRARERGDQEETAWCLWVLTDYAQLGDDHVRQCAIAEETLALRRALGDDFYVAHALIGLQNAYFLDSQLGCVDIST